MPMNNIKIGLIIGSLRADSYSRKVAQFLTKVAPPPLQLEIIELNNLSMYNQDLEKDLPAQWSAFRNQIKSCTGIIFVTPEYNRSIPGVLKNAIDIGSRPISENAWKDKPAGIVSISPGVMGAFGANHHLRQCLVFLNVAAMPQPEVYLGKVNTFFNENGVLINEDSKHFLEAFMQAYKIWLSRFANL